MNLNSPPSAASPWKASVYTKIPSEPSSAIPTATSSPLAMRRISFTQSVPPASSTSAPSVGAATKRASGKSAKRAALKSGCLNSGTQKDTRTRTFPACGRGRRSPAAGTREPGSEDGYRVPVDRDPQLRRVRRLEPTDEIPHHRRERRGLVTLEQHVPAPPALDPVDRARGRPDQRDLISGARIDQPREPLCRVQRQRGRGSLLESAAHDVHEPHVWRIRRLDARGQLCPHERVIVVRHGAAHRVVRGDPRLNDDVAAFGAPAGTSRHLAQQLEAA